MKKLKKGLFLLGVLGITTLILVFSQGILWFGEPSWSKYPVRGVDVSHYQGIIDWNEIAKQNITFAFIKATEGSKSSDENFKQNWDNIGLTKIKRGAYHFFSFDSDGEMQAKNYISVVPISENMLPPVVDVEFYSDKEDSRPNKEELHKELDVLLKKLEEHYGKRPIIYTTMKVYLLYIDEYYDSYPLWIRNTYYKPFLIKNREWLFWQYSDKTILSGYKGDEKYIDMNIFNGDLEDFNKLYK